MVCGVTRGLATAIVVWCVSFPGFAQAEPWDISLKFEGSQWLGNSVKETIDPLPDSSFVVTQAFHSKDHTERYNADKAVLNSDLDPLMRYHFSSVTYALPSMVYIDQQKQSSMFSPSALSSFIDRETSDHSIRMAGAGVRIENITVGGGYLWRQPLFTATSNAKTEGMVIGLSYNHQHQRTNMSYLASYKPSFQTHTQAQRYESLMLSHSWATRSKFRYTATAQYKKYSGNIVHNDEETWLVSFGVKWTF